LSMAAARDCKTRDACQNSNVFHRVPLGLILKGNYDPGQ
jgi:hypothetical protein